jgi:putative selenium metabolism protein SsnA
MVQLHNEMSAPPRPSLALVGGAVAQLSPARVERADVLIRDGKVAAFGGDIGSAAETLDCSGKLVMPGFACGHTHLYSALARGMPPPSAAPENFVAILERVWWRLDRALDADSVELSALVGAMAAVRAGCTTLVDHHASPGRRGGAVDGSLDLVGGAVADVGLRGVLCYETTERNGDGEARAGVRENDRFLTRVGREPPRLLRGLVGAHAAFTLSDATAEALADVARRHQSGVHIHVAEDAVDARHDGRSPFLAPSGEGEGRGGSTVAWLAERGLVTDKALLAHCVHVDDEDAACIVAAGAHVAHNPRSNANNAVGYARPSRFGEQLILGTDGIGADMPAEAAAAFFGARAHRDALDVIAAVERTRRFAAAPFGGDVADAFSAGALGDFIVLDYDPPTPLDDANVAGHFLFGFADARVVHVVVDGRVILRDGRFTTVDERAILARARTAAARLWGRL